MKVVKANLDNFEAVKRVAEGWRGICNADKFGIEINDEVYFSGLKNLITYDNKDLLLLVGNDGGVVGYMGIEIFNSPLGNQKIANEHYLFMSRPSVGVMLLIKAAKEWAREKGCSHLILNASNLASDLHDKVCRFYEKLGLSKFETCYMTELRGE
jgi:GNAT superfamily N-acetyltransferase